MGIESTLFLELGNAAVQTTATTATQKINKDKAEKLISEGKFPGMSLPGQEIPPKERKTKKERITSKTNN